MLIVSENFSTKYVATSSYILTKIYIFDLSFSFGFFPLILLSPGHLNCEFLLSLKFGHIQALTVLQ